MEAHGADSVLPSSTFSSRTAITKPAPKRVLILSNFRSGSTLLGSYVSCHQSVHLLSELLNDEFGDMDSPDAALAHVCRQLNPAGSSQWTGFKVHLEQTQARGISIARLVQQLGISAVVMVYRSSIVEQLVSRRIAEKTNVWVSTSAPDTVVTQVSLPERDVLEYYQRLKQLWECAVDDIVMCGVPRVVLSYESLISSCDDVMAAVWQLLRLEPISVDTDLQRQNPAPLADKVENWSILSLEARTCSLDVQDMLDASVARHQLSVAKEKWCPTPECQPRPYTSWRYRVAEPYIPPGSKDAAVQALYVGAISSAAPPVTQMSLILKQLFSVPVAQPCANGFVSLLLALQCAKVGKGDLVLVPSFTMVAVPNAVVFLGATPVFVDNSDWNSYNPSVKGYAAAAQRLGPELSDRIKAVIVAHTYGVPAEDIEELTAVCKTRKWVLVEDISECVGVRTFGGRLLGTFGDYACASMYANKTITAGDGGFVLSRCPLDGPRLTSLVNHGFVPAYHFLHLEPCIDGKMNGLAAALASPSLLDIEHVMAHRAMLAACYRAGLAKLPVKCMPSAGELDAPWVFGIVCESREERDGLRAYLAFERGIETRAYFPPLDLAPAFLDLPSECKPCCPCSRHLGDCGLYLPTHTRLRSEDVRVICDAVRSYFNLTPLASETCSVAALSLPKKLQDLVSVLHTHVPPLSGRVAAAAFRQSTGQVEIVCGCENMGFDDVVHGTLGWQLGARLDEFFCAARESWSAGEFLLKDLHEVLSPQAPCKLPAVIERSLRIKAAYIKHMQVTNGMLPVGVCAPPWHSEVLLPQDSLPITTSPMETIQLLVWLVRQRKLSVVLEMGCWLGHTTLQLMHAVSGIVGDQENGGRRGLVIGVDTFVWREWMNKFVPRERVRAERKSFRNATSGAVREFQRVYPRAAADVVLVTPKELADLRIPGGGAVGLVFLDTSGELKELEDDFDAVRPKLVPGYSVVVINMYGRCDGTLEFVLAHRLELQPIAKPGSPAKAFLFVNSSHVDARVAYDAPSSTYNAPLLPLRVVDGPSDWGHHCAGGFKGVIEEISKQLDSARAEVAFVPAVESYFLNHEESMPAGPWLGILHQVPRCGTLWTPDLERLLVHPAFLASLKRCLGLFTLTSYGREYVRARLAAVPVTMLHYPAPSSWLMEMSDYNDAVTHTTNSTVEAGCMKVVMIGGYERDFDAFMRLELPPTVSMESGNNASLRKCILLGEASTLTPAQKDRAYAAGVELLSRLSDSDYACLIRNNIPFLSLKQDGIASTLVVECAVTCTPILVKRLSCVADYLGDQYPLFFSDIASAGTLLTAERLSSARSYLQTRRRASDGFLTVPHTIQQLCTSAAGRQVPRADTDWPTYDVSIVLNTFRRTDTLATVLQPLLHGQDFTGRMEVIVWNNDRDRLGVVDKVCLEQSRTSSVPVRVIHSSDNVYVLLQPVGYGIAVAQSRDADL